MTDARPLLQELLAQLEALYLLLRQNHWAARCYAEHLLFERLYGPLPDTFDSLAEKAVKKYGPLFVDQQVAAKGIAKWLESWANIDPIVAALNAENSLQKSLTTVCGIVGDSDLGMDNFLRGVADERQTALYLLTQAKGKP